MRNNLKIGDHFKLCGQGLQHHIYRATRVADGRPAEFEWVVAPRSPQVRAAFDRYLNMGWDVERVDPPEAIDE